MNTLQNCKVFFSIIDGCETSNGLILAYKVDGKPLQLRMSLGKAEEISEAETNFSGEAMGVSDQMQLQKNSPARSGGKRYAYFRSKYDCESVRRFE